MDALRRIAALSNRRDREIVAAQDAVAAGPHLRHGCFALRIDLDAPAVRGAIEAAQESGLELNALGSGIGHEQSPQPGTHVATGTSITVKFER